MYYYQDPLPFCILLCLQIGFLCSFLGTITRFYSWVDRIWSILPFVYPLLIFLHPLVVLGEKFGPEHYRNLLMFILTLIWGVRLTFNYARKGGYGSEGEDYRWIYMKKKMPYIIFELMNWTFIGIMQITLLFLISCPAYLAWRARKLAPLN